MAARALMGHPYPYQSESDNEDVSDAEGGSGAGGTTEEFGADVRDDVAYPTPEQLPPAV